MKELRMAVKTEYFNQIKSGEKIFEYRLFNEFWRKKLVGKNYDYLVITLGYPKAGDADKMIKVPYRGYDLQTITHKHFGDAPVNVFALRLTPSLYPQTPD
jgi:hypothetical protein